MYTRLKTIEIEDRRLGVGCLGLGGNMTFCLMGTSVYSKSQRWRAENGGCLWLGGITDSYLMGTSVSVLQDEGSSDHGYWR